MPHYIVHVSVTNMGLICEYYLWAYIPVYQFVFEIPLRSNLLESGETVGSQLFTTAIGKRSA
jgi:hypothetical protein